MTAARALALGTLAVGTLDLLDAFVFFGLRGVQPGRILQGIAAGLLGTPAFRGGAATMALGLALHFLIAFSIVATYFLASRLWPALAARPILYGAIYGVIAYVVMSRIVVPLSLAPGGTPTLPVIVNGVFIHILGVGIPSGLAARAAASPAPVPVPA